MRCMISMKMVSVFLLGNLSINDVYRCMVYVFMAEVMCGEHSGFGGTVSYDGGRRRLYARVLGYIAEFRLREYVRSMSDTQLVVCRDVLSWLERYCGLGYTKEGIPMASNEVQSEGIWDDGYRALLALWEDARTVSFEGCMGAFMDEVGNEKVLQMGIDAVRLMHVTDLRRVNGVQYGALLMEQLGADDYKVARGIFKDIDYALMSAFRLSFPECTSVLQYVRKSEQVVHECFRHGEIDFSFELALSGLLTDIAMYAVVTDGLIKSLERIEGVSNGEMENINRINDGVFTAFRSATGISAEVVGNLVNPIDRVTAEGVLFLRNLLVS